MEKVQGVIRRTLTQFRKGRVSNSCRGEERGEGEESVQEESATLVGGSLLSAQAPKTNSTVVNLIGLKTGHQKYHKTRTEIAIPVAATVELGRQGTGLRREITRPRYIYIYIYI